MEQITSESKLPPGKHVAIFSRIPLSTLNGIGGGITPRNELFGCVEAKGFDPQSASNPKFFLFMLKKYT